LHGQYPTSGHEHREIPAVPSELRIFERQRTRIAADFSIVCPWAAFALGCAAEVGHMLAVAG
jgi:hypothetical protein